MQLVFLRVCVERYELADDVLPRRFQPVLRPAELGPAQPIRVFGSEPICKMAQLRIFPVLVP
jgi:hypothetical protein